MIDVLVTWAYRRRALVIGAAFCILAFSAEGARRLSFETDVLSLLPRDGRVIPAFRTFLSVFGSLDQLYVVFTAPAGAPIADYSDRVDEWIEQLRAAPEIDRVDTGMADESRNVAWLADRQLLLLDNRSLDEALQRLRPDGLRAAVASRRELLTLPSSSVADLVRHDPAGLFELTQRTFGGNAPIGIDGGYVTQDGSSRLVIARPRRPPYDAAFSRALDARLTSIAARQSNVEPALRVEMAGGHRIAVETEAFIRRESIVNTVGSLVLILPLLFLVFRSPWLVAIGPLPSALSLVVVLGVLGFAGATLSAAATGSAAMLFGLGVDGVVLLYVSHRLALAKGLTPQEAAQAIAEPSKSMLLGMWTTAVTFYGLMFVDFPSLQELGRLVGHSMVVCGLATLFLVPATLPRNARTAQRALVLPGLAGWIFRHRTAVLAGSLIATLGLGAAASRIRINPTLERLRSTTDAATVEARIASTFGLPGEVSVIVAHGPDLDRLLSTNETVVARLALELPTIRVEPPSRLLPSVATQAERAERLTASGISPAHVRTSLADAAVASGFQPAAFDAFIERLPRLLDARERITYENYVSSGFGDFIGRFIAHDGRDAWTIATYVFPQTPDQLAAIQSVADAVDPTQTLTGLPVVNRELSRRFMPQFFKGLGIGTIMVLVSLVLVFRKWRLCALALLPTFAGLVWTAGALALAGVELDLFAVFAVVTFVGIGVDYGIHMVHRYRERGDPAQTVSELAPVILAAAAITLFGYGTLITSSYPPLRSIGIVSAVSVCALAVASVILLPALMMRKQA
ncbi:MAG TPA: MMPL family transporter [Vicinamibacterales bacterium]|nr:MMPL family transporter [Vicinamibacterales bacterium]